MVQDYVARTRQLSTDDYIIERLPDRDNLSVYRVTRRLAVGSGTGGERVFEVYIDADNTALISEHRVE